MDKGSRNKLQEKVKGDILVVRGERIICKDQYISSTLTTNFHFYDNFRVAMNFLQ